MGSEMLVLVVGFHHTVFQQHLMSLKTVQPCLIPFICANLSHYKALTNLNESVVDGIKLKRELTISKAIESFRAHFSLNIGLY